jgi:hypothetical protein
MRAEPLRRPERLSAPSAASFADRDYIHVVPHAPPDRARMIDSAMSASGLASISTEQSSPHMIFAQTPNFPAISAGRRYPNWGSDREVARRLFPSHGVISGTFSTSKPNVRLRRSSISAPIERIDRTIFPSHLNHLNRRDVSGISFRGNPG